ncbi:MAG: hypothetical protein GXP26_10255 [Planctomycetes bacterium]|nr:hypothetical protein [Planctomycetota bacterium]
MDSIRRALSSTCRWPAIGVLAVVAIGICVVPARGNPLSVLNDEFEDGATISDWARIHEVEGWNADHANIWDIDATQPGRMVIEPHTTSWYQDYRGILAFKEVSGDFSITSQVYVTDRDLLDDNEVPFPSYSLAGLMIRRPRAITNPAVDWTPGDMTIGNPPNGENYVFLSIGQANNVGGSEFQFEVKNTRNSNSQLQISSAPGNLITIQLVRIGDSVLTLYQEPGEDWVVHRRYDRADLPETLQVGMVAYTEWDLIWPNFTPYDHNSNVLLNPPYGLNFQPDLTAGFEYARFYEPSVPAELVGVNLFDEGQVSDTQLLSFLGDIANQAVADADFDQDDDVDGSDFLRWQTGLGTLAGASLATGNADFDGDVDQDDFFAWQQQFGSVPNGAAAAVPEPATLSLLLFAGLLGLARPRNC